MCVPHTAAQLELALRWRIAEVQRLRAQCGTTVLDDAREFFVHARQRTTELKRRRQRQSAPHLHSAGHSRRRSESNATGGTPRGAGSPRARPRASSRAAAYDAEGAAAAAAAGSVNAKTASLAATEAEAAEDLRATEAAEEDVPPAPPAAGSGASESVDGLLSRTLGLSDAQLDHIKLEITTRLAERLRQPGAAAQWSGTAAGFERRIEAAARSPAARAHRCRFSGSSLENAAIASLPLRDFERSRDSFCASVAQAHGAEAQATACSRDGGAAAQSGGVRAVAAPVAPLAAPPAAGAAATAVVKKEEKGANTSVADNVSTDPFAAAAAAAGGRKVSLPVTIRTLLQQSDAAQLARSP